MQKCAINTDEIAVRKNKNDKEASLFRFLNDPSPSVINVNENILRIKTEAAGIFIITREMKNSLYFRI